MPVVLFCLRNLNYLSVYLTLTWPIVQKEFQQQSFMILLFRPDCAHNNCTVLDCLDCTDDSCMWEHVLYCGFAHAVLILHLPFASYLHLCPN